MSNFFHAVSPFHVWYSPPFDKSLWLWHSYAWSSQHSPIAYTTQELGSPRFISWEAPLPSDLKSPTRTCWALMAWTLEKRQSCSLGSTRSPTQRALLKCRLIGWSDRLGRSRGSRRDQDRGPDSGTGRGAWTHIAAPASGRGVTASGNCPEISEGWRMGRRLEPSPPRHPGGSSRVRAGGMGTGMAGSLWLPRGSSCRYRRRGRRGEATSWPDADACPSSYGSGTTPRTRRHARSNINYTTHKPNTENKYQNYEGEPWGETKDIGIRFTV